jgi:hypothetical protein
MSFIVFLSRLCQDPPAYSFPDIAPWLITAKFRQLIELLSRSLSLHPHPLALYQSFRPIHPRIDGGRALPLHKGSDART